MGPGSEMFASTSPELGESEIELVMRPLEGDISAITRACAVNRTWCNVCSLPTLWKSVRWYLPLPRVLSVFPIPRLFPVYESAGETTKEWMNSDLSAVGTSVHEASARQGRRKQPTCAMSVLWVQHRVCLRVHAMPGF